MSIPFANPLTIANPSNVNFSESVCAAIPPNLVGVRVPTIAIDL